MKTRLFDIVLSAIVILLFTTAQLGWAAPVTIVNPDFEMESAAPITGWGIFSSGPGALAGLADIPPGGPNSPTFDPVDNDLFINSDETAFAGVGNYLGDSGLALRTANTTYTLTIDVGFQSDPNVVLPPIGNGDSTGSVFARLFTTPAGMGGGGTQTLFTDGGATLVSSNTPAPGAGAIVQWTLVYESNSGTGFEGQEISIQLASIGGPFSPPAITTQVLFDNVTLDASPTVGAGLVGDYNGDNVVDAADYTVWRDNLGAAIALTNEDPTATPGMVTQEDYVVWKNQFGEVAGGGAAALAAAPVPEPASGWLLSITILSVVLLHPVSRARRWRTAGRAA